MKDDILLIIHNHYPTSPTIIDNAVANELQRLMCYQEARAIIDWVGHKWFFGTDEFQDALVDQLRVIYEKDLILEAIEKVKNESQ